MSLVFWNPYVGIDEKEKNIKPFWIKIEVM